MTNWTPRIAERSGPRYRAIADALAEDIGQGRLTAGQRLPTQRELAHRLGVTVGTITRAYAEAERRGLIGGEVGRGTFVQVPGGAAGGEPLLWAAPLVADSLIALTVISPPQPAAAEALAASLMAIATSGAAASLIAYAPHTGLPAHRTAAASWMNRQHGAEVAADNVLLTTGAQNAMAVALAALARPGDVVLTERLTNHGMRTLAQTLELHLEGLALDEHGVVPDSFDSACRRLAPRLAYLVPTLQNPTASVMPEARRRDIIAIARRHGVVIVEDDVFGFLTPGVRPIQALAPDITVYLTSVSKSVAAGLRVGYLAAPPHLAARLEVGARALHYSVPSLTAEIISRWIADGQADRMAEIQRVEAAARQALARRHLPAGAVLGDARGFHVWLTPPEPWRTDDFVAEARRRGVLITGADAFAVGRAPVPPGARVALCMPASREAAGRGALILAQTLDGPAAAALSIL